ncbi:MAG: hypothetical protein ACTSXL_04900 [Alphaproteobacteria bacterium]|nr:MAG: hypothetical protein B6I23_00285 [Rickettsiaceae bacterium 4572_127]
MKRLLLIFSIFLGIGSYTAPAVASKGMFLCVKDTSTKIRNKTEKMFQTVDKVFYLFRIIAGLFCGGWFILLLTKSEYQPATPWKKFYQLFFVVLAIIFLSIVIKVFSGKKLISSTTYIDVRRNGIAFAKCDKESKGAIFVPARYVRKLK